MAMQSAEAGKFPEENVLLSSFGIWTASHLDLML